MMKVELAKNAANDANDYPLIIYFNDEQGRLLDFLYVARHDLNNEVLSRLDKEYRQTEIPLPQRIMSLTGQPK